MLCVHISPGILFFLNLDADLKSLCSTSLLSVSPGRLRLLWLVFFIFIFLHTYIHICACIGMCMCVNAYLNVCVCRPKVEWGIFLNHYLIQWGRISQWNPECTDTVSLHSQLAMDPRLCCLKDGIIRGLSLPQAFMWALGIGPLVLMLTWQGFNFWSISPAHGFTDLSSNPLGEAGKYLDFLKYFVSYKNVYFPIQRLFLLFCF